MPNYSEKLTHPNWQRRRLEIMQRDEFTCQLCGDKETTLNVHHKIYKRGEIWEYDDSELITYCKVCHSIVELCKRSDPELIVLEIIKKGHVIDDDMEYAVGVMKSGSNNIVDIFSYDNKYCSCDCIVSLTEGTSRAIVSLFNKYSNDDK